MENMNVRNLVSSAGGSFSFAWRKIFEKAFLPLLLAVIIVGLLNGPTAGANWKMDASHGFSFPMLLIFPAILFGLAYGFLFMPIIKYGEQYRVWWECCIGQ